MSIPPVPPLPRTNKSRTPILTGCVVFLLLIGLGVAALVKTAGNAKKDALPYAETFLSTVEKGDLKSARQQLSKQAQTASSLQQMQDIISLLEKRRGKMTGHSGPSDFGVNSYNGVTSVTFVYKVNFTKGSTDVRVVMVREGNSWRVYSFNYQL